VSRYPTDAEILRKREQRQAELLTLAIRSGMAPLVEAIRDLAVALRGRPAATSSQKQHPKPQGGGRP
jgi:hypothetical protein